MSVSDEFSAMSDKNKIERFEDLIAWQKARILTQAIYQVTQDGKFARDIRLSGQIQRAAVSIMSNIAEGFERSSLAEFYQFLSIAKSSCGELRSQLYVALDIGYIDNVKFHNLFHQTEEVGRIIGGLQSAVEKQKHYKNTQIENRR